MDRRKALMRGHTLEFSADEVYRIENEIGRGGSCIVYDASYLNNIGQKRLVRIKECYPYRLEILRSQSGELAASDSSSFNKEKGKFISAFRENNRLFTVDGLANSVNNTIDIYYANGTVYIVSAYFQGETISEHKFNTLKDCVSTVKSAAKVIEKMHNSGYLYLDVKPENVIVLNETAELVRLVDFDSLRYEDDINERVSFTRGYAAPEQTSGSIPDRKTDIYGIGALLFELIFGRIPDASDCGFNAEYDYSKMNYCGSRYDDRLFPALNSFFSHTITNFPPDRYSSAIEAVSQLEIIEKYSDLTKPFIVSSHVSEPKMLFGRMHEAEYLESRLSDKCKKNISVYGMGGIGKSTLVRKFIAENREKYHNILYLYYKGSVTATIVDDTDVFINTIHKFPEENKDDYFRRKVRALKELIVGTNSLLVIDNYEDTGDEKLREILGSDFRVVLISRRPLITAVDDAVNITEIKDRSEVYELFAYNLGKEISERDYKYIDNIIEKTAGHTLTIALIARQISKSFLSVKSASALIDEYGITGIGNEKIGFDKDYLGCLDNMSGIISRLLKSERLNENCRVIMKILSAVGAKGINVFELQNLLVLENKDDINYLAECGWCSCENNNISVHPVISDIIVNENWSADEERMAELFAANLCSELSGNNKSYFIGIAESFIDNINSSNIKSGKPFGRLIYCFVNALPTDCYDKKTEKAVLLLKNASMLDKYEIIGLYDCVISGYEMLHDYEKERHYLGQAAAFAKSENDNYITAVYSYLLAGYYDCLDEYEKTEYYIEKALKYAERSPYIKSKELAAECVMSLAFMEIRSFKSRKNAASYIKKMGEILKKNADIKNNLLCNYEIAKAWFYALYDNDISAAEMCAKSALKAFKKSERTDLEAIDNVIITYSNILADIGLYDKSAEWLNRGIKLCEKHDVVIPYMRKKEELLNCLLDIFELNGNDGDYKIAANKLKKLKEKMSAFGLYIG